MSTDLAISPVTPPATESPTTADPRYQRGVAMAALFRIKQKDGRWVVPSAKGQGSYTVHLDPPDPSIPMCTCPDFAERGKPCKHVYAVRCVIERESHPDGSETITETVTVTRKTTTPKKPTHKQNWPMYDKAQTTEKRHVQSLLAELCRGIAEPPRKPGPGRKPIPLRDGVFAAAFKVYSTMSARRFMCDLSDAQERGHVLKVPHFTAIADTMESPAITPILRALISESSRPLASIEQDFAADSSGFTTCRFETWYDHKYGVVRRQHEWVKVHVMCGVRTNVVTAVEIKGKDAQDAPQLPAMLDTTAERFTMREVSADKVYASLDNYAEIAKHGATPYIPFKSNHTGAGGGLWAKMFHYYNFNRDEFLGHYHKRSNVESTFSMVKAKFGDAIRSKTDTAMVNEALCKILCHNLCRLVASTHELGINAKFWADEPDAARDPIEPAQETVAETDQSIDMFAWM
jgi:transposase